jgi:hypothetical protein
VVGADSVPGELGARVKADHVEEESPRSAVDAHPHGGLGSPAIQQPPADVQRPMSSIRSGMRNRPGVCLGKCLFSHRPTSVASLQE